MPLVNNIKTPGRSLENPWPEKERPLDPEALPLLEMTQGWNVLEENDHIPIR